MYCVPQTEERVKITSQSGPFPIHGKKRDILLHFESQLSKEYSYSTWSPFSPPVTVFFLKQQKENCVPMNANTKGSNEVPFSIIQDYNVITGNNNVIHELLKYPSPPGSRLALNAPAQFI